MNVMRRIEVEKVTVNMGVGQAGEELEKAITILNSITSAKPVKTISKIRQPTWGIRLGLTIGTKTTLRKDKAEKFLKEALAAKDNAIESKNFDNQGNFGFGIREHIDLAKVKYDPKLGIRGFDVLVTLKRPGYRVKRRKIDKRRIPLKHVIPREEAIEFVKQKFGVVVE
ncbi:MAG: 50S ribosomal protein L5 [Candidatus Diapherotrites archaeon]|uniref:Large ribosomal subunit protein uL5 n=1 Tax=Candidatus Iainarchaeum sp. TaxID=3101447 RepID=A0A7J4IS54_9ARCH|nr:MAG: large subunit ribosomal protein L5 [archaeon GW2011_AR10]AJS11753.1 50S ribosomal protein L5P [uncultured archaeon]MBS3059359.1 50S ribosomal protein L5 [Candidatus Diapherotrites archaeon]HIH08338.1 50S ribosomal protein L5 [Candidatus Diapherotrites archaeon]